MNTMHEEHEDVGREGRRTQLVSPFVASSYVKHT